MLYMLLLAVILGLLLYYYIVKPLSYWKDRGVPQGKPVWFFGDTWGTFFKKRSILDTVLYIYNQCPGTRYSGMYQFNVPTLVIKDPELLKRITVKDFDHFLDHRQFRPENCDPLWGKNLFALRGQRWRDMRTTLSPSFTSSKMKSMLSLMVECAETFVQHFQKKDQDVVTIELRDAFTRYTNDIIASTAFGIKVDSLTDMNNEFYLMGNEITNNTGLWKNLQFVGYFIVPKLYDYIKVSLFNEKVEKFFRGLIDETLKTRKEQGIVRLDMIHLLMQARKGIERQEETETIDTGFATAHETLNVPGGKSGGKVLKELTNEDITAQALIFFFAGFDSVSALMNFTAYELAVNQNIQDKLQNEVLTTFEECGGKLTYEAIMKMKYMDMVISECLRKWPNFVSIDRTCTKPYTIEPEHPNEKPVHIEKGQLLFLPIIGFHLDPQYFPNPDRFDPERFSDENKHNIKPFTYFPFGLGPRNCIGSRFALLEAKIIIFYMLANYRIIPVEKSVIPLKLCKTSFNLRCDEGFWFGLKRITK